jgi:DNA-binding response OmpR family regulator
MHPDSNPTQDRVEPAVPRVALEQGASAVGKSPLRVLLVDDENLVRIMCARGLKARGHMVIAVADGEDAWEQLQAEEFDLLITDHKMPRLTGLNLIKRIRTAKMTVPSILISGNMPSDEPDLHALIQPGQFLQKPFDIESLIGVVNGLVRIPD